MPSISTQDDPDPGIVAGGADRRRPSTRSGGTGRSIALNVVLAILVAGLMVAGWFVANQHQLLLVEQDARTSAEKRLQVLEDRLRLTDETVTESGTDTSKQINRWESEIRKLWAVANERNKDWIKTNESALTKQSKSIAQANAAQTKLQSDLNQLTKALGALDGIREQIQAVDKRTVDIAKTQTQLVDRVNKARQAVASLQGGLVNRVEETEQAIASMDAFRVQINQRLSDIERRLNPVAGG